MRRTLLLLLSCGLLAVAFAVQAEPRALWPRTLSPLPAEAPPTPLPSLSAQTCNGCHATIHDQWAGSAHAQAATDPVYLAAAAALGSPPLCDECHLPMTNQRATLPKGPGALGKTERQPNPTWNPTLAQEGVTCAACHVRDGTILGPRELPAERAPHPVKREPALQTAEACAFCHQAELPGAEEHPFLDTVGEWQRSPFAEIGVVCQDCHMTRVSGSIAGSRFAAFASHGAPDRAASIARALTTEVSLKAPQVQRGSAVRATVTVMNTGAGHAVPTGDPSHEIELRFRVETAAGELAAEDATSSAWIEREVSPEPPFVEVRDERLDPAASRVFDFTWTPDKKLDPGRYTVVVSTHWWAIDPTRAQTLGLSEDAVRVDVASQRIPLRID